MEPFVLARAAGDLPAGVVVLVELRRLRLGLPRLALALAAIVSASVEIEQLTLEPGRLHVEERGLRPTAAVLASAGAYD